MRGFTVASELAASPERVWARIRTMEGVNYELRPLVRMTHPPGVDSLEPEDIRLGERIFRSWVLLFGFLPVDYDDITLVRIEDGRAFLERSPMLTQRVWEHERTVEPVDGGCRVTDRVSFEPRIPFLAALQAPIFRFVFRHRHRRLRRAFG